MAIEKNIFPVLKNQNSIRLINLIRKHGSLSRPDLVKFSGLRMPTVYNLINNLCEVGLLLEEGVGDSSGGRKPMLLKINSLAGFCVGVDLSSDVKIKTVLSDLSGNIIDRTEVEYKLDEDVFIIINKIVASINDCVNKTHIKWDKIIGVGVSTTNLINSHKAINSFRNIVTLGRVSLGEVLSQQLPCKVFIENDANAYALAERWVGSAQELDNFVHITVGRGIGSGLVLNGSLYRGSTLDAGEITHMIIDINGATCSMCGRKGCLRTLANTTAVLNKVKNYALNYPESAIVKAVEGDLESIKFRHLLEGIHQGDELANEVIKETGEYLAIAILNLVSFIDVKHIVLGGEIALAGKPLFLKIEEILQKNTLAIGKVHIPTLIPSSIISNAGTLGALAIVLEGHRLLGNSTGSIYSKP